MSRLSAHGPRIAVNATAWLLDYCLAWLLYLPHIAGVPCGLPTAAAAAAAAAAIIVCMAPTPHSCCTHVGSLLLLLLLSLFAWHLPHIAVVHMWAPYCCCCCCYHCLHGCLPTPHSWCTLWAPIAAAAITVCMAAYLPHIAVVHMWAPITACCFLYKINMNL